MKTPILPLGLVFVTCNKKIVASLEQQLVGEVLRQLLLIPLHREEPDVAGRNRLGDVRRQIPSCNTDKLVASLEQEFLGDVRRQRPAGAGLFCSRACVAA